MNFLNRFRDVEYSPLSTPQKMLPKRYVRLLLVLTACTLVLCFWYDARQEKFPGNLPPSYPKTQQKSPSTYPPLYEKYSTYEDRLSEWNLDASGNNSERYIYVASHGYGAGWGNIMQEMVFNTLLASGSGRGFVWDDYIWNIDGSQYSQYNGKYIPSKIPLSAMIAGHIVGLPKTSDLPPSISKRVYHRICPENETVYLTEADVMQQNNLSDQYWHIPGQQVLDAWLSLLNSPKVRDAKCVETRGQQIFSIWLLHNPRLHSLAETLFNSPVLSNWDWSKLVKGLFRKNRWLFVSSVNLFPFRSINSWLSSFLGFDQGSQNDSSPLPLLVLHLRRGDYEQHCHHLTKYRSTYIGMISLPEFEERDAFVPPNSTYSEDSIPEDALQLYSKHCYPNITQISQRVREVVHDYEIFLQMDGKSVGGSVPMARDRLKKIYIMTNGQRDWLEDVKGELMADARRSGGNDDWRFVWNWEDISTSRDLVAGWEEKPVRQLLDMYVGQRAELFIGNGFSTLTGNIVMLRKHRGLHPVQTRLW